MRPLQNDIWMLRIAIALIYFVAVWDWFTTVVGVAAIIEASGLLQYLFCGVTALAMSFALMVTPLISKLHALTKPAAALAITMWIMVFLFNLFTTFAGHTAIVTETEFRSAVRGLLLLVKEMSMDQLVVISATTLFVVVCTMLAAYWLNSRQFRSRTLLKWRGSDEQPIAEQVATEERLDVVPSESRQGAQQSANTIGD